MRDLHRCVSYHIASRCLAYGTRRYLTRVDAAMQTLKRRVEPHEAPITVLTHSVGPPGYGVRLCATHRPAVNL